MSSKVLVADDERLVREPIAAALEHAGYQAVMAKNGAETMAAIGAHAPRLVLLDLDMPGLNGLAVLEKIRELQSDQRPRVIVLTALHDRKAVLSARALGVRHFMLKSAFSLEELLRRIKEVLSETESVAGGRSVSGSSPSTQQSALSSVGDSVIESEDGGLSQEDVAERLRALKPMMTRDELMKRVTEGNDLRALAPAVKQVLSLTSSDAASLDAIAKAIRQDQALSLKILKVANSPIYAQAERVDSLPRAVARIGVAQIRAVVLSLSVIDQFSGVNLPGRIRADWFWEHSLACGLIAARLARLTKASPEQVDAMFTAGLLHDVGRMIFADRLGSEYGHVLETAHRLELPLEVVESKMLLINHADLTDRLLRSWRFAPELINPIAMHHLSVGNIRRMAPQMVREVALLALANRLAHALLLGSSGNDAAYSISEFIEVLELTAADLDAICREIPEQTDDLKLTMMSYGASGDRVLAELSKSIGNDVKPLLVARREEISGIGILLKRLCPMGADETPNVLVLRVSQTADRALMLAKLKGVDEQFGTLKIPLVVVGNAPGCLFKPDAFGERHVQQLLLPLNLSRLTRALQDAVPKDGVRGLAA